MKKAFIFPGQGAQFSGMGRGLYNSSTAVAHLFEEANDILGFDISQIMFEGTDVELKQTNITQPAIFIHSIAAFISIDNALPDMVAGHSLGEFSALVANKVLTFSDALMLVSVRASAMQKACDANPSTMAAILNLPDNVVEQLCTDITNQTGEVVVAANYNCPGQIVISGSILGVEIACEKMKAAGAKRALILPVGGAFHSPLMSIARQELADKINSTAFGSAICPVYQNVAAAPIIDTITIKENLIAQLTGAVKWTHCVQAMIADGATLFAECGPGKVLQGLVQKINKDVQVEGFN